MLPLAVVVIVKVAVLVVLSVLAASSSLAQDPRINKILPIDTIKNNIFFIFFPLV